MVIAPGRQDREPTAKRMGSVDTGMTTNLFVYDQVDAASLVLNLGEPTLEAEESHTAALPAVGAERHRAADDGANVGAERKTRGGPQIEREDRAMGGAE
jgi:hypothetical protein